MRSYMQDTYYIPYILCELYYYGVFCAYLQYIHESQEQEMLPKTGSAPFVSASRVVYKKKWRHPSQ